MTYEEAKQIIDDDNYCLGKACKFFCEICAYYHPMPELREAKDLIRRVENMKGGDKDDGRRKANQN